MAVPVGFEPKFKASNYANTPPRTPVIQRSKLTSVDVGTVGRSPVVGKLWASHDTHQCKDAVMYQDISDDSASGHL